MTDVVAALIWDGNRFLACQRPAHKARGLLWEFVGGKVEPGETKEEALIRECQEELDITVGPGTVFMELVHEYPDLTVRLTLLNATITEGQPRLLEHNDIRWITTKEIPKYDFCPADVEILLQLQKIETGLQAELLSFADSDYRAFQMPLIPGIAPDRFLGVRFPVLRKIAARMKREGEWQWFLEALPHRFYEEDCLHAMLVSQMKDPFAELDRFLPYVDNWSVCDTISPKSFCNPNESLLFKVKSWLQSDHPYTVRFGMGVLMRYFLDDNFDPEHLSLVASAVTDHYYVKMMAAWYYATALAKQYDAARIVLETHRLPAWVHQKTIQKATESFRISPERKAYLRTLRIK